MEVFGVDALGYCYKTLEVNATTKKGKAIRYELRSFRYSFEKLSTHA